MRKRELADLTWDSLEKAFPDSECTLERDLPERLAIRGILSAQCTDVRVNLTCRDLFAEYKDMESLADATVGDIADIIRPCGLTGSKSRSVHEFARLMTTKWQGRVPDDVNELMSCPGIGKKIANLIVGEIYGIPAIVVDTHCKRVMYRIGLTNNTEPLKVESDLCKVFPRERWITLGHKAVDLGRAYCKAAGPKCGECPCNAFCRKRDVK